MPKGERMSEETVRRIVRMYEAGDYYVWEIATEFHVDARTIYRIAKKHNLPPRPQAPKRGQGASTRRRPC